MGTVTPIQAISSATPAVIPAINVGDPVNSAIRVNVVAGGGGGGGGDVNLTQVGGAAIYLGSVVSADSLPVVIASDQAAIAVKQATASNLNAAVVGVGTAGTPAGGVLSVQGVASGTPQPVSQATASNLNATVIGAGSAGTANAGVLTVQGIASMTPVQVSQATASNLKATVVGTLTHNNAAPVATNVGALVAIANASSPSFSEGDQVLLSTDLSGNLRTSGGGGGGGSAANLQASPITLFDQTTNQAGVSQLGSLFPKTVSITTALPAVGSGSSTTLTNSSNVCGAVFSGLTSWSNALIQFAGVTGTQGETLTVEIGRIPASGAMAEALASVVLTASSLTIGATTTNPFTGGTGHSSVTWRLFDVTTITSYSQLGDVLQAVGGTTGVPSQININVASEAYYYVVITALNAAWSEILCCITPTT